MNVEESSTTDLQHYPMVRQIEQWPIDKLIPYAKNARTHSLRRIAHLTGQEPVLAPTGASMTQVAAERGVTQSAPARSRGKESK